MLGCNAKGDYPTKFKGGLFTVDSVNSKTEAQTFSRGNSHEGQTPDYRMWGGSFTAQNQRLVYWPMLKSGDFDLMPSQLNFYTRLLHNAELRTWEYWKHPGCSFTEQLEDIGLPIGWTYGYPDTACEVFRRPADYPRGDLICPATRYHYSGQLEFAYMMLQYHRFTNSDVSAYLPFINSAVTFYFEHYQMRHRNATGQPFDEHDKFVIAPSKALESYTEAVNPADAVAGLRGVLTELIRISGELPSPRI
jgi:hypothetical protein